MPRGWLIAFVSSLFLLSASTGFAEIQPSLDTLDDKILQEGLLDFVRSQVGIPFDSISVWLDSPNPKLDTKSIVDVKFERVNERPLVGTCLLRISISLSDGSQRDALVTARVRIYRKVAVASLRLPAKKVILPDDIRIEMREVTSLSDRPITSHEEILGQRTRRSIPAGRVLLASDFEPIPVIERGSSVMISVVIGAVTVTSKAVALEDGSIGEKIWVQDVTTKRRLIGTVVGKGLVVLERPAL